MQPTALSFLFFSTLLPSLHRSVGTSLSLLSLSRPSGPLHSLRISIHCHSFRKVRSCRQQLLLYHSSHLFIVIANRTSASTVNSNSIRFVGIAHCTSITNHNLNRTHNTKKERNEVHRSCSVGWHGHCPAQHSPRQASSWHQRNQRCGASYFCTCHYLCCYTDYLDSRVNSDNHIYPLRCDCHELPC